MNTLERRFIITLLTELGQMNHIATHIALRQGEEMTEDIKKAMKHLCVRGVPTENIMTMDVSKRRWLLDQGWRIILGESNET